MAIKGCILPWVHIHGDLEGHYKVCCFSEGASDCDTRYSLGTNKDPLLEVWNGEKYKNLRKSFLAGEIPEQCKLPCYDKEKLNTVSPRQISNKEWESYSYLQEKTSIDGELKSPPIYIDYRFGNTCNFRCRMCSQWASTSWFKESKELGWGEGVLFNEWDSNLFWDDFYKIHKYIKEIYFAGGEPLVLESHYKVLQFLIDNNKTDVHLTYNTNLSHLRFKDYDLLDLWSRFKKVSLYLSLDGIGTPSEYIRKGLNWNTWTNNLQKVMPYVANVAATVQVLNIYNIPHLVLWCRRKNLWIHGTTIVAPPHHDPRIFDEEEKAKISSYYKDFMLKYKNELSRHDINQMFDWLKFIRGTIPEVERHRKIFYRVTNQLDKLRNEKLIEAIPELTDWYKRLEKQYGSP